MAFPGRQYALVGGLVALIGITLYPIAIKPMYDEDTKEYYKQQQKIARHGHDRDKMQPGNMKVWSDPFDRKKNEE